MTVQVIDNDGCLVIFVYAGTVEEVEDGAADKIGMHDTGLDGNVYSKETEVLAEQLVASLVLLGINAVVP
jgi:hypothetical protein